jgi:hypothetical protein
MLPSIKNRSRPNLELAPVRDHFALSIPMTPGVGTYDLEKSRNQVGSKNPQWSMVKEERVLRLSPSPSMKQLEALPGIGTYETEKCYESISRPYAKNRAVL